MKLKIKFNVKSFLEYIIVILATAFGITTILIALPLTERISDRTSFDLLTKEQYYWAKEYTLSTETTDKKELNTTKNILYKRLRSFGVEEVNIFNGDQSEDGSTQIKIDVTTTANEELVDELVTNQFYVEIMTRKEDVDFEDEENPYAYLLSTNYDSTGWDRSDFRNVYITELKTTSNTDAYFAIFKPWLNKRNDFLAFLESHAGEYIGVSIDGFVTPYYVSTDDQSMFAVSINMDDEYEIKALSSLYNSGIIPGSYALESEQEIDPQIVKIDYVRISIVLTLSLFLTYTYLIIQKESNKELLKKSFLTTVLTASFYLTFLKIFQIPIDTFLLPIFAVLATILIKVLSENKDSVFYIEAILIVILLLTKLLGSVYMDIFATHMIALTVLSELCLVVSEWYINKIRRI